MQHVITEILSAPWAVLPDRRPFIRAAVNGALARRRQTAPRASIVLARPCLNKGGGRAEREPLNVEAGSREPIPRRHDLSFVRF